MKKITRKQHFVPRCLLKNFSYNDGAINIFDSTRNKLRPSNVGAELFENNFYDKDNTIENFLRDYIEGPGAQALKIITREVDGQLDFEGRVDLLRFILVQLSRTPNAYSSSLDNIDNYFNELINQLGQLNGFDKEALDGIKVSFDNPKYFLQLQTLEAALKVPLLLDLEWHILINETATEFVISDHPVVHYNWYLRILHSIDISGLSKCGLQVFLPISSTITLCLYDSKIYKMGAKNSSCTIIENLPDIHLLNELQFRSRGSFIVFRSTDDSNYVKKMSDKFPANSNYSNTVKAIAPTIIGREAKSKITLWRKSYIFDRWLSFCKVKNKKKSQDITCYDRIPEELAKHEQFIKEMRSKKE